MSFPAPSQRATVLLAVLLLLTPLSSSEEKRITVYSSQGAFLVPTLEREQKEYFRVLDVLEHFGSVNLKFERQTVRMRQGEVEGQFEAGKASARIGRLRLDLSAPVLVEDGQVLLPVSAMQAALAQFIRTRVEFHEAGRRVFVGDSVQMASSEIHRGESSALVLNFPAPVNPTISTEGGRMRLIFQREPIMLGAERISYQDKVFSSLAFTELNGMAEVAVTANTPLIATFSNGNKTITIAEAPAAETKKPSPTAPVAATPSPAPEIPAIGGEMAKPAAAGVAPGHGPLPNGFVPFFVLIDASHGGTETGARFSDKLVEKEITLALARRLRAELQAKGITAVLLRDSDATLSGDERAVAANSQRAGIYVSIHAAFPGHGVRIYSALPPYDPHSKDEQIRMGPFQPWENVQGRYVDKSRLLADTMAAEFGNRKLDALAMSAGLSPLNHIAAPAVAIEITPSDTDSKLEELANAKYQTRVAQAAASALVLGRIKLEAPK